MNPSLIGQVFEASFQPNVYQATKYVSPSHVIKVTRRRYKGKLPSKQLKQETVLLTMGKPNYREREFIKSCQKAREPFPIRKIQLRLLPDG